MSVPTLYHYTCDDHGAPGIDRDGVVRPLHDWRRLSAGLAGMGLPTPGLWDAPAVAWLTNLDVPNARGLGLGRESGLIRCDRTAVRYTVDAPDAVAWLDWCARWRPNPAWRRMIEKLGLPGTWWVTEQPARVLARLSRREAPHAA